MTGANALEGELAHRYLRYDELRPARAGFNHMLSNLGVYIERMIQCGLVANPPPPPPPGVRSPAGSPP